MLRHLVGIVCLLGITCSGLSGCASSGIFSKKQFGGEQWEPEIEEVKSSDWRSAPSALRKGKAAESREDRLDKLIWSDEARDINRSLGGSM